MTATHKVEPVNYAEQIRKNWAIILFLGGAAGSILGIYFTVTNDIKRLDDQVASIRVEHLSTRAELYASQQQLSGLSGDIREIKASLSFIKDRVAPYGTY